MESFVVSGDAENIAIDQFELAEMINAGCGFYCVSGCSYCYKQ